MKILFTVANYWPKLDGVQMVTTYLAEGLSKLGHEISVITSRLEGSPIEENHNGVRIIRMEAFNYLYWHKGDKQSFQEKVLDESKNVDAVVAVCLQSYSADWLLPILEKITCKKIIYMHGMPDFKLHRADTSSVYNVAKTVFRNIRWFFFYRYWWKEILHFDAAIHLFRNDNSFKYFKEHGFENNFVIENSCENEFFDNRMKYGSSKIYLCVGNYCQRKNQIAALQSFYKCENDSIELVFVGSKENIYYRKLLKEKEKLENKFGKRKVQILTNVPRTELVKMTKEAYCTIMASTYEYYPIVLIESIASGVPFISTNVGVVRYLPGGVVVDNLDDMSYWIDVFANDEQLRDEYGILGMKYAESHLMLDEKLRELEKILSNDYERNNN